MKLKKFFQLIKENEEVDDDIWGRADYTLDDSLDNDIPDYFKSDDDTDEEAENVADEDIIENLLYTLRKMIKPSFEKSYVFTDDDGCINIQFVLKNPEKINNLMKVMNILKKLENDILIQYDSEFDLWETKDGEPLVTAKFYYDEDVRSKEDAVPF